MTGDIKKENAAKEPREPLFHIIRRTNITKKMSWLIRAIAFVAALIVAGIVVAVLTKINPFKIYITMFDGAFGSNHRIISLIQKLAILLCISLAVTPAFRMKFWNCGAEGQALMGGLAAMACMIYLGDKVPNSVLVVIMAFASIAAGCIWAVIPAIFKAHWNTNETLFTLMMNYVAIRFVTFCVLSWPNTSGSLPPKYDLGLPSTLFGVKYLPNIIIVAILTVICYYYLKYSKHGYEISVVGESENTARYIGINVKKVIIRTVLISGAICGICGYLLVAGTDHTISTETVGGQGFTAIMVSWLAKFNPIYMVLTAFLVSFLKVGAKQISTAYKLNESVGDILVGIILFFIIGCEFFINYKIVFRSKTKKENK